MQSENVHRLHAIMCPVTPSLQFGICTCLCAYVFLWSWVQELWGEGSHLLGNVPLCSFEVCRCAATMQLVICLLLADSAPGLKIKDSLGLQFYFFHNLYELFSYVLVKLLYFPLQQNFLQTKKLLYFFSVIIQYHLRKECHFLVYIYKLCYHSIYVPLSLIFLL